MTFSMLYLYLMGLADPSEVEPFGLLENAEPPPDVKDPYTGAELTAASFPHFADTPVTVKATRKTIAIDEIIATNGPRMPARKEAPQTMKLGIVLMVSPTADDDAIAKAEATMDPIAAALAPAYERATRGRGRLEVVTVSAEPVAPAEDPAAEAPGDGAIGTPATTSVTESGCAVTSRSTSAGTLGLAALVASLAAALVRRRRAAAR
jgi:hypothetical protein